MKKQNEVANNCLDLEKWWIETFSREEREYMTDRFQPMGGSKLIDYLRTNNDPEVWRFLGGLMSWFRDKDHRSIYDRIHLKVLDISQHYPLVGPGYLNGRALTTYWPDIERLKKNGSENELEQLLITLIELDKIQANIEDWGVIPGFYYELCVLYRKNKDYEKEVSVLEDFSNQKHANGEMPGQLIGRLEKAKKLRDRRQSLGTGLA